MVSLRQLCLCLWVLSPARDGPAGDAKHVAEPVPASDGSSGSAQERDEVMAGGGQGLVDLSKGLMDGLRLKMEGQMKTMSDEMTKSITELGRNDQALEEYGEASPAGAGQCFSCGAQVGWRHGQPQRAHRRAPGPASDGLGQPSCFNGAYAGRVAFSQVWLANRSAWRQPAGDGTRQQAGALGYHATGLPNTLGPQTVQLDVVLPLQRRPGSQETYIPSDCRRGHDSRPPLRHDSQARALPQPCGSSSPQRTACTNSLTCFRGGRTRI